MTRTVERVIDLAATAVLLCFAWLLREAQPGLAGAVVMASISFWLQKNASAPNSPAHMEAAALIDAAAARTVAAATAAAEVLRTAEKAAGARPMASAAKSLRSTLNEEATRAAVEAIAHSWTPPMLAGNVLSRRAFFAPEVGRWRVRLVVESIDEPEVIFDVVDAEPGIDGSGFDLVRVA